MADATGVGGVVFAGGAGVDAAAVRGTGCAERLAAVSAGAPEDGATERMTSAPASAAVTRPSKPPAIQTARGTVLKELLATGTTLGSDDMESREVDMPLLTA